MSSPNGTGIHEIATPEHDRLQKWFSNIFSEYEEKIEQSYLYFDDNFKLEWEYQITSWDNKTPVRSADFVIFSGKEISAIVEIKPNNKFFSVGGTIRQLKNYEQLLKEKLITNATLLVVLDDVSEEDEKAFEQANITVLTVKKWEKADEDERIEILTDIANPNEEIEDFFFLVLACIPAGYDSEKEILELFHAESNKDIEKIVQQALTALVAKNYFEVDTSITWESKLSNRHFHLTSTGLKAFNVVFEESNGSFREYFITTVGYYNKKFKEMFED